MLKFSSDSVAGVTRWFVPSWEDRGVQHGFLGRELNLANTDVDLSPFGNPQLLQQVHGAKLVEVFDSESLPNSRPSADGWLVRYGQACVGILTADCFPVLVVGRKYFAALHCGWRGAVSGLLPSAIFRMCDLGESVLELEIAIGPGASEQRYEVKGDVVTQIQNAANRFSKGEKVSALSDPKVVTNSRGRYFANISALLRLEARSTGVAHKNIETVNVCTISCPERLFSYRREKDQAGRQLSYIFPSKFT